MGILDGVICGDRVNLQLVNYELSNIIRLMNKEESAKLFFQCLGEIWRDITWIEFLMRCAIAKHD